MAQTRDRVIVVGLALAMSRLAVCAATVTWDGEAGVIFYGHKAVTA